MNKLKEVIEKAYYTEKVKRPTLSKKKFANELFPGFKTEKGAEDKLRRVGEEKHVNDILNLLKKLKKIFGKKIDDFI